MTGLSLVGRMLRRLKGAPAPVTGDSSRITSPEIELGALFAAMTDRVVVVDREGRYVQVAQTGGHRLFDNDPSIVGRTVADVRSPEISSHIVAAVHQALDTGKPTTAEIPFRGDWGERWLSGVFSPLTAETTVAVVRDVTESVLAKRELERQAEALQQEVRERTEAQDELRALFAAMTDRVVVLDRDGLYLRISQTSADTVADPAGLLSTRLHDTWSEERADMAVAAIRQCLESQKPISIEYHLDPPNENVWMAAAISPLADDTVLAVVRDISERINAQQELERQRDALRQEVKERQEAQDELRAVFAAMIDRVIVVDRDGRFLRVPKTNAPQRLLQHTEAQIENPRGNDVEHDEVARKQLTAIRQAVDNQQTVAFEYPLEVEGETLWMSAIASPLGPGEAVLVARDITELVQAQTELERRVEERTRELTAMLDIAHDIGSTIELEPLLQIIIDRVRGIVDYHHCSIYIVDDDGLALIGWRLVDIGDAPLPRLLLASIEPVWTEISLGKIVVIDDIWADTEMARAYRETTGAVLDTGSQGVKSWMGVPLISKERVIGMLALSHSVAAYYTAYHAQLVRAIGTQAAIAIENAQLHEQTLQLATMQERQRLARELHDSVSQALYGIGLGAETARSMLKSEEPALQPVEYVLTLAAAGMAEMRALIFELRPESLEVEGLVAALQKQVLALSARYRMQIEAHLGEEPSLTLSQKEVFYRIGQEALHNIVKHAKATEATVRLQEAGPLLLLEVSDNGAGFDTTQSFPGHIGLMSMSERAASIGAKLELISSPGAGTTVRLTRTVNT